jgi:hypothetical protein
MVRKSLLICGILSSRLYVAVNVFVPLQWEGYRSDETALGLAGHRLLLAGCRLRMGRLEISRPEPTPARRGRLDDRRRSP